MAYKGVGGSGTGRSGSGTGGSGRGKGKSGPRQPVWTKRGGAGPKEAGAGGEKKTFDAGRRPGASKDNRPRGQGIGVKSPQPPFDKGGQGGIFDKGGQGGIFDKGGQGGIFDKGRQGGIRRPEGRGQRGFARQEAPVRESATSTPEERVMGINPVLELLKSGGRPVDALLIDKDKGGKQFEEIIALARGAGIRLKIVPRDSLEKLAGAMRHQGVVAITAPKGYKDPDRLIEDALAKGPMPLILILDGVEDPQNLGTILRTAESAGVDGVVIPEHRAVHLTPVVARASAGALEHIPVAKVTNVADFIGTLKENGFWIVGLEGGAKDDYTAFDMSVPLALVLGGEGKGIRPLVRKKCDALVSLPMLGKVSSLNVSVAAGVVLYEVIRQRKVKSCDIVSK